MSSAYQLVITRFASAVVVTALALAAVAFSPAGQGSLRRLVR